MEKQEVGSTININYNKLYFMQRFGGTMRTSRGRLT